MEVIRVVASIAYWLITLYVVVLFSRALLQLIPIFDREWRPRGAMLVIAEIVYTLTDPPLKFFGRFIRPLRIGPVAIDLAFLVTFLCCSILLAITRSFMN